MRSFLLRVCAIAIGVVIACGAGLAADAGPISTGTYRLGDHPDGNVSPPKYGLRLDGLDGDTSSEWTFSFSDAHHPDVGMTMVISGDLDAGTGVISIFGTVYGGKLDNPNDSWITGRVGLWDVEFEYQNVGRDGNGLIVMSTTDGENGSGKITPRFDPGTGFSGDSAIDLKDHPNSSDVAFRMKTGHRGHDGLSGFGWLTHGNHEGHVGASDWLFTAELIPLPPSAYLGAFGLAVMVIVVRRRF